jgi:surface antigen
VVRARTITPVIAAGAVAAALHVSVARAGVIAFGYPYATSCPAAGIAERVDRWKMYVCNCTSYVAWALSANGQTTSWFIPGSMDARNWAHVAELKGIPVGRTPRVGSVAVWPRLTPLGHVAYVTGLDPGGRFDVGEYNLPVLGAEDSFAFDLRRGVARSGVLFVYVPRRRR